MTRSERAIEEAARAIYDAPERDYEAQARACFEVFARSLREDPETVERVANAIWRTEWSARWEEASFQERSDFLAMARSSINALFEETGE